MEYRNLGKTGLPVSVLSYGAWVTFGPQIDDSVGKDCLVLAYENGVNFFDNAEVYEYGVAEEIMGKVLKDIGWDRDTYIVSSKVFFGRTPNPAPTQRGLSRKHIVDACHAALKRLQVDYLDLYFCHRNDPNVPIEIIVESMNNLVRQGKILYWGTSEWPADRIQEAYDFAIRANMSPPLFEQPQYNILHRARVEEEYKPLYTSTGLGTTIWSPLASGLLTGKYNNGIPEQSRLNLPGYGWLKKLLLEEFGESRIPVIKELATLADELGTSLTKLSLAWCVKNPHVSTVILGASNVSQLEENLAALEVLPLLTDKVMQRISKIISVVSPTMSHGNE